MYALVISGTVKAVGQVPATAKRLSDGAWITPPDGKWTDAQAAASGWLPFTDKPRPTDDATDWTGSQAVVAGVPTQVWTARPWTPQEAADRAAQAAQITDLTARVALLEKAVFGGLIPPPADDAPIAGLPVITGQLTAAQAIPPDFLGVHLGKRYRNVSGVALVHGPDLYPQGWLLLDVAPPTGAWKAGETVKAGDVRTYAGKTYTVTQGHTTQAGWEPPNVPALWKLT